MPPKAQQGMQGREDRTGRRAFQSERLAKGAQVNKMKGRVATWLKAFISYLVGIVTNSNFGQRISSRARSSLLP